VLTDGVPLLLRERHRSERDDLLLFVIEVGLDYRVELVDRCRQCFTRLGGGLLAPGRTRGRRGVQCRLNELVLALDLFWCRRPSPAQPRRKM
jgi:hypothetical protein